MSVRAVAVLGLLALVSAPANAKPRKKRGPLAAYIDPGAPDDPPRPKVPAQPVRSRHALSIVLLLDRSIGQLDRAFAASYVSAYDVANAVREGDQFAVMAFDATVEVVQKPTWGDDVEKLIEAVDTIEAALVEHDVPRALDEARDFISNAPRRRVLVLVARSAIVNRRLIAAINAIRTAKIDVIVLTRAPTNPDPLQYIANGTLGTYIDTATDRDALSRTIQALR